MTLAILDGDIISFRCACTAENDPEAAAIGRADELVKRLLEDVQASSYQIYIGGRGNWRKEVYPEYKAHRKDKPKPKWLDSCNLFLREQWQATSEDGLEADDLMSIRQHECLEQGLSSVICSIDKDMFTCPGEHYQWEISGPKADGTRWTKEAFRGFISPLQALRRFYGQVIAGDGADNVPSFDGKLRNSVPKFVQAHVDALSELTEEIEMYNYCLNLYEESFGNPLGFQHIQDTLHRNASVLYLLKKRGELWAPPNCQQASDG